MPYYFVHAYRGDSPDLLAIFQEAPNGPAACRMVKDQDSHLRIMGYGDLEKLDVEKHYNNPAARFDGYAAQAQRAS